MKHEWNTGRHYTEEGQRIVAEIVEGGIKFEDIDRNIGGFIPWLGRIEDKFSLRDVTMFCYDHGHYQNGWGMP